jgi:hypothetical protein
LFERLLTAQKTSEAIVAFTEFKKAAGTKALDRSVGLRPNNRGTIDVATDPGRSVIERVTNAIDALLELEHTVHKGKPECKSPRDAAEAWLGLDRRGLGSTTPRARQALARRTVVQLEPGEGKESRIVTIRDSGIGLSAEEMPKTILSLNEGNKWQKHYLAGTFGQGGSSTFAFSKLTLLASRKYGSNTVAFTVVRYKDLPPQDYKSGHYVYVAEVNLPLTIDFDDSYPLKPQGTLVRHFGYDLTNYPSPFGERSLYGAMNRLLFDPVAPIWFENKVEGWNRGIYGSRTRLNSGSEDAEGGSKLELAHQMPMFSVSLGEHGLIGLEYWVLLPPEKASTVPIAAYVDHRKPIVLSINGQNQSELSALLIRKDAELPYLKSRLICHIDCDGLSPGAKRALFASTREQAKEGYLLDRIREEFVSALKSDDELTRLNREAKDKSLSEADDETKKKLQKEVAKMMKLMGKAQVEVDRSSQAGTGSGRGGGGGGGRKLEPLETREPPTFIRLLRNDDEPVPFYRGQRRWLRIETDAPSEYHSSTKLKDSKMNFLVGEHLKLVSTTSLRGGRMRVALESAKDAALAVKGTIRVELYRSGLFPLTDEASYEIVADPKPKEKKRTTTFPDFRIIPVDGPDDESWRYISEDDTNITRHASAATLSEGVLYIYYSKQFPKFEQELQRWEGLDIQKAKSFQRRYEIWVAVHSLLMQEQEEERADAGQSDEAADEFLRQERCRFSVVATMIASQEVKSGEVVVGDED